MKAATPAVRRAVRALFTEQPYRHLGTGEVLTYCQAHGATSCRLLVRQVLEALASSGLLERLGPDNGRVYRLIRVEEGR
jgi:Fe2+ or Zn2+ uptake regulation protein